MIVYKGTPIPFSDFQVAVNHAFYSVIKDNLSLSFTTYVESDDKTAMANAIEFQELFSGDTSVLEQGVGHGMFTRQFLRFLEHKRSSIEYFALDISQYLLDELGKSLEGYSLHTLCQDVEEISIDREIDYARFNEVWDDLRTDHYWIRDGEIYEIMATPKMYGKDTCYMSDKGLVEILKGILPYEEGVAGFGWDISFRKVFSYDLTGPYQDRFTFEYLNELKEKYPNKELYVPINTGAVKNLKLLIEMLSPRGIIDAYDYGFIDESIMVGPDERRLTTNSGYRGQITSPVNFHYISQKINCEIELQRDYIGRVLGKEFIELDSLLSLCPTKEYLFEGEKSKAMRNVTDIINRNNNTNYSDSIGQFVEVAHIMGSSKDLLAAGIEIEKDL